MSSTTTRPPRTPGALVADAVAELDAWSPGSRS